VNVLGQTYSAQSTPGVEEIQDIIEKVLVENGHYKTAKAYILYRAEHARIREAKNSRIIVEDNVPYKLLWKLFTWNVDHGCDTIDGLNRHIRNKTFHKLVSDVENFYHSEISTVAEKIIGSRDRIKIAIVSGPSSSGKTTTTAKIGEALGKKGLSFKAINVDNYFRDLEEHPKDEYGDHDFENPQALDLELINSHLYSLINGKTVMMPKYDFKTGRRTLNVTEFALEPGQILLIDSLHGLYPDMTASIPHEMKFKFYIEALCQIRDSGGEFVRWADLRMLRRMVRDALHRSYDPEKTVGHWHYVRRSEMKYIVPYISKADYVFNGSLSYELSVHKKYLFNYFPGIVEKYESDPKRQDAFIRAKRVYNLLKEMEALNDDSAIPAGSLMREFIGGSSYQY